MKSKDNYALSVEQAKKATENGKFVALYGMEYGVIKNGGHVLIYCKDKLIGWEADNYDIFNPQFDYTALFTTIASTPNTFATLAHPDPQHFSGLKAKPYTLVADQAITGVAITTGQLYRTALQRIQRRADDGPR